MFYTRQLRLPVDVTPHWTYGKDTGLDVTVVNPLKEALLNQAATIPGHALFRAFNRTISGTGEACRRELGWKLS